MRTAGVREARQNLTDLLDDVKKGREIVITDRGDRSRGWRRSNGVVRSPISHESAAHSAALIPPCPRPCSKNEKTGCERARSPTLGRAGVRGRERPREALRS